MAWVGRVVGWWQRRRDAADRAARDAGREAGDRFTRGVRGRGVSSSAGTADASPGHLTDPPRYTFGDQHETMIPPPPGGWTYIGGPNYRAPGRDRHGTVTRFCPEGVNCSACNNLRP